MNNILIDTEYYRGHIPDAPYQVALIVKGQEITFHIDADQVKLLVDYFIPNDSVGASEKPKRDLQEQKKVWKSLNKTYKTKLHTMVLTGYRRVGNETRFMKLIVSLNDVSGFFLYGGELV